MTPTLQHSILPPPSHPFLQACRREPVSRQPVWLMRQAGRYMKVYRELRAKHTILEMIKAPELAAEVTLQPLRAYDLDAGIIFADILTLPEAMGLPLQFVAGEGPVINTPVRSLADVEKLKVRPAAEALPFTLEAIRMVCRELNNRIPLIGFSGAPFTLACYAVEGGSSREFDFTRSFMFSEPKAWHALMAKLAESVGEYLSAQAAAGAQALQVFDSWAGSLSPADFREYVLPHTKRTIELAKQNGVPVIYFSTRTAGMLPELRELGADVYGLDWRLDLPSAWAALGDVAIQGNLDPTVLLSNPGEIRRHTARVIDSVRGRPGYIFNIGHGVIKETPEDHVKILVDYVHEHRTA